MLLSIDIGNTHVTCAIYDKKWIHTLRIPSNLDFWELLSSLKEFKIKYVAVSSVVPKLSMIYIESIRNLFQIESFIITKENCSINLKVDDPKEVGIDRICNSVAAQEMVGCPTIIGDIGSATNYDVIDHNGTFIGGAIAPGIDVSANYLIKKAALLNKAIFKFPNKVIGKNTNTNLQSGIMYGGLDSVEGMIKRIINETNYKNIKIILTGGFSSLIADSMSTEHLLDKNLTLYGLKQILYNYDK